MAKAANLLPKTIEQATKGTPVAMLMKVVNRENIEAFLAIELTKLASLINVDERLNLQGHQIPFICSQLLDQFPNESLADFKICFDRGSMGRYDDKLLRLDGAIISQWMGKYLEEKYQVVESMLMAQKENPYEVRKTIRESEKANPERNLLALLKTVVGEQKPEEDTHQNTNDYIRIKMQHAKDKREKQDKLNRASSEFYAKKESYSELKTWEDNKGFYVMAETSEDADEIYKSVIQ